MHTESSAHGGNCRRSLERAIVLALLGDEDGARRWSRAELGADIGVAQEELARALSGLLDTGVVQQEADRVWASCAARRLDELELIGI